MASAARKAAEESLRDADKIVNRWVVYPHRVPKSEIVGTLILLRDAARALLAEQGAGALPDAVRAARDKARAAIDREGGPMTPWGLDMCAVLDALDDWERFRPAPSFAGAPLSLWALYEAVREQPPKDGFAGTTDRWWRRHDTRVRIAAEVYLRSLDTPPRPAPSPASDEVRGALAEIVEWAASEAPCSCNVDSPVECWFCRWHGRATAALAARGERGK